MLNGLDLFSGIGGISYALRDYVRPIAYCEIDPYCQAVLLNRMVDSEISMSPIWDDICTFTGCFFENCIDVIYGGFPCQDISVAGHGKGLAGERSGLYWQVHRLAKEIKPKFIFLENVPVITSRGGLEVVRSLTEIGYDCRWCTLSAQGCGAPHKRERWWLLAHSTSVRCEQRASEGIHQKRQTSQYEKLGDDSGEILKYWENTKPPFCGVDDGIPDRVHQIRALGNSVVPQTCLKAFKHLMGI